MNANHQDGFTVRELMQVRVHSVDPSMPLEQLEQEFIDKRVSGFPVVEGEKLVGVVSRSDVVRQLAVERSLAEITSDFYWDRAGFHEEAAVSIEEIANRLGQRIEDLRVGDLMSRHLVVVGVDDSIEVAAQKLLDHHIHRMPVVDGGRLVGLISTLDFVRLFADGRAKVV